MEMGHDAADQQVVIFRLGESFYAIDIAAVREIIRPQPITPVPQSADCVLGVINLRSAVVPVIDLRKRCGLPHHEETRETRIVVVQDGDHGVGLVVDAVTEVTPLAADTVDDVSAVVHGAEDQQLLRGVARHGDRLVMLLDLARAVSISRDAEDEPTPGRAAVPA